MNKFKFLIIALLFVLLIGLAAFYLASGLFNGDQEKADEAGAAAAAALAEAEKTLADFEALVAEGRARLSLTPKEKAYLDSAVAVNALSTPNGIFTNQDGQSGYFGGYEAPFNFRWTGGTTEVTAFDGRLYQMINGSGELVLKLEGQDTAHQKYIGDVKDGLWHGQGQYWTWDGELIYEGGFNHDRMSGLGTLTSQEYDDGEVSAYVYEGEIACNYFHGQGTMIDKVSGHMIYKGLWFEGDIFGDGIIRNGWTKWLDDIENGRRHIRELERISDIQEKWNMLDALQELYAIERQYKNVLMTGVVEIGGRINDRPGEGLLTVIPTGDARNITITDQAGRSHPVERIVHPMKKNTDGQPVFISGSLIELTADQYPLTLTVSYDEGDQREYLRLTVKRPFTLILE